MFHVKHLAILHLTYQNANYRVERGSLQILELSRLLHASSNPYKLMALLRAFFDESGLHDGAVVTGVAGFVGPADEWEALEKKWQLELARFSEDTKHKLDIFHATDCNRGEEPWFGIKKEIREAYNLRLAKIVEEFKRLKGIAIAVEKESWDRFASPEFKERYRSPYQLCAEHCFQLVASYSLNKANNTPVALVFAEHHQYASHIGEIFSYYMDNKSWAHVKSLTFASPLDCPPLQSADMLSYESYRYWDDIASGGVSFLWEMRPAFKVLEDAGHFELSACYGNSGMRNAVSRFHNENGLTDPYGL